jgi:DnaJ-class molecular chaperone
MKGTLDPAKLAELARAMGTDMSELTGIMGKRPGFDPYMVLGLDKSASDEEIRKRYHELLRKLHPDTAGVPGTEFLFQTVMAAFRLIAKERGWQ